MNWFQKNKKKIIAGIAVLAVLAFAFWYGGDAPGLRGWSTKPSETKQEQTENQQTNTAETQGESGNTSEETDQPKDEKQDEDSKAEGSGEEKPGKTESSTQKTEEKPEKDKPGNEQNPGVKPDDKQDTKPEVKPEDKQDSKPEDKPDPAPEENPGPVNPSNHDAESAKAVEDLIDSIGKVSLDSKSAIDNAQLAYDKLSDAQKALVGNKSKLDEAKAEYARLVSEEEKQKEDSEEKKPEEEKNDTKPEEKPEEKQDPKPEDKPEETPKPEDKPEEKPEETPDPTPEDNPDPVEPEKKKELHCKFSISCKTILSNLDSCDPDKRDYVPKDGWIYKTHTVTFTEGESVYDVLKRICKDNKIQLEASFTPMYNSVYVEGIHNLYEFDVGNLSGWMYKVNGWFPNYGASRYVLKDGDECCWVYTCDLGYDVGGGYAAGGK